MLLSVNSGSYSLCRDSSSVRNLLDFMEIVEEQYFNCHKKLFLLRNSISREQEVSYI